MTGALRVLLGERALPGDADWSALGDPGRYRILQRFFTTWTDSTSLQGRHLLGNERLQDELCLTLAAELGRPESDDRVQTMGAMLVAAIHLRHRTFTAAVLAGAPAGEVEDRVRESRRRPSAAWARPSRSSPRHVASRAWPGHAGAQPDARSKTIRRWSMISRWKQAVVQPRARHSTWYRKSRLVAYRA